MGVINEEVRFRQTVSDSWLAVWKVAQHFHSLGDLAVWIEPLRLRPSFEQRDGYGDRADMRVRKVGTERWVPVEVKWRGIEFSTADDYPYPTVFVDRSVKSDAAQPVVCVMVNKSMTHAARIDSKSRDAWIGPRTYMDSKKGYQVTVYECPVEFVSFFALAGDAQIYAASTRPTH